MKVFAKVRGLIFIVALVVLGFASYRIDSRIQRKTASENPGVLSASVLSGSKIVQLTHAGQVQDIADPDVEYQSDGRVRIYGTSNGTYLEYQNESDFLHGLNVQEKKYTLLHPDGTPFTDAETPWDLNHLDWSTDGKTLNVFYAGAMTPQAPEKNADFGKDNFTRRSHAFVENPSTPGVFTEAPQPLMKNPDGTTKLRQWIGHNYGRHFVKGAHGNLYRENGALVMFYERIGRLSKSGKLITEIAARKIKNPLAAEDPETVMLTVDEDHPYPAAVRASGDLLMEGPRVSEVVVSGHVYFVMGFSSGDFPTNHYGVNVAYSSEKVMGSYHAILNDQGTDLRDFASAIRDRYNISWGPGRPEFFQDSQNQWWMAFHGVNRADYPGTDFTVAPADTDLFFRNVYIVPVSFSETGPGVLDLKILDQ